MAQTVWTYEDAFARNNGLISEELQDKLRQTRVAIGGMGGVGGIHAMTQARLGIGKMNIADNDEFDIANFNRQYGANIYTLGENKATVMKRLVKGVNPEIDINCWQSHIDESNVDEFLDGVNIFIDGIDFFEIDAKMMIMDRAYEKGLWCVTAGPVGFGTAWVSIHPTSMYKPSDFFLYDKHSTMKQKLLGFAKALAPHAIQENDVPLVDFDNNEAPSLGLACNFASGVVATEVIKIVNNPNISGKSPKPQFFDPMQVEYV